MSRERRPLVPAPAGAAVHSARTGAPVGVASGTDLTTLLGVDQGQAALDETPLRLTRAELFPRLPEMDPAALSRAGQIGLVRPYDEGHFVVRSPALLGLVADSIRAGVPLESALDVIEVLTGDLGALARKLADLMVERGPEPALGGGIGVLDEIRVGAISDSAGTIHRV